MKRKGDKQAVPVDVGSDIKSGPFPRGSKPLKENVNKVTVPSTNKDETPTNDKPPVKTEVREGRPTSPPTLSSAEVCKAAEQAIKEHDENNG